MGNIHMKYLKFAPVVQKKMSFEEKIHVQHIRDEGQSK